MMKIKLTTLALLVGIGFSDIAISSASEIRDFGQKENAAYTDVPYIDKNMLEALDPSATDIIALNKQDGPATTFYSAGGDDYFDLLELKGVRIEGNVRFNDRAIANVSLRNWGDFLYTVDFGSSADAIKVAAGTVNEGYRYLLGIYPTGKAKSFTNDGRVITYGVPVAIMGELESFTNSETGYLATLGSDSVLGNGGIISGDILNHGTIEGKKGTSIENLAIENQGTILGAIINTGNIKGSILNAGTLAKGIKNDGIIQGIYNEGFIKGDIINHGTVKDGIFNLRVFKDVELGGTQLILGGDYASTGVVNGNDDSGIWIGTLSDSIMPNLPANFRATSSATVGSVNVTQISRLTLADNLNWQAKTIVNNGKTVLGNGSALTGTVTNAGTLALSDGQGVNAGVNGDLTNSGSLVLNPTPQSAGNTLTIDGNYTGVAGSKISFGSVLGGDNSQTDRLIITGNSDGNSALSVTNVGGTGGSTLEGLRLIQINGNSDATFALDGRLVAGIWDYSLVKGNTSGTDSKGWYLTSYAEPAPAGAAQWSLSESLTSPGEEAQSTLSAQLPQPKPVNPVRKVRPEAASYAANLSAANTLFNTSLSDRVGETQYLDPLTREVRTTSMWMRNLGGHNRASLSDGQNKTSANRYVLQIGGDIMQWSSAQAGRLSLGVMGGYANQKSHSRNSLSGYDSRGSVNGYSAGLYGTWYQHASDKAGLYADSWVQYNWFNNEVKGQDLAAETYKSHGLTASLESGYNYRIGSWISSGNMENSLWLRPRAQVIWMGVKASDHTESNGTRVTGEGNNNIQTRLGLRTYINGKSVLDKNSGREFQPFAEANWIYNSRQYGAALNGDKVHIQGSRNIGELKVGVEGKLSNRLSLWTDVAQQMGGSGYNDTQGTLGVRYQF